MISGSVPPPSIGEGEEADKDIQLMRLPAVLAATTLSRSTFLEGVKIGIYPKPVAIGLRSVAWRRRDIAKLVREGISPLDRAVGQSAKPGRR